MSARTNVAKVKCKRNSSFDYVPIEIVSEKIEIVRIYLILVSGRAFYEAGLLIIHRAEGKVKRAFVVETIKEIQKKSK